MPTGSRRALRAPGAPALLPSLLLALLLVPLTGAGLTACTAGRSEDAPVPPRSAAPAARDVVREVTRALDRRAAAVRRHDAAAFAAGLARRPALARQQRTYFANLAQLPLAEFRYEVDRAGVVRDGGGYRVPVRLLMRLDGYDERPVASLDRLRFVPSRHGRDRMLLSSVTDAAWERRHHVQQQPWDRGPIEVRTAAGVLGVFDPDSVDDAPDLLASVASGIDAVAAEVPYDWSRTVVLYALSDPAYLDGLQGLPGDPARLDGVAFPLPGAHPGRPAATRFLLSPSMLGDPGPSPRPAGAPRADPRRGGGARRRRPGLAGRGDRRVGLGAADRAAGAGGPVGGGRRGPPGAHRPARRRHLQRRGLADPLRGVVVGLREARRGRRARGALRPARRLRRPRRRRGGRPRPAAASSAPGSTRPPSPAPPAGSCSRRTRRSRLRAAERGRVYGGLP